MIGKEIYNMCVKLFPIMRSITGDGNRITLNIIKEKITDLNIYEIPTGSTAFDWTVPKEWNIKNAYIEDENANRIVDMKINNLHVLNYSAPIDKIVSLSELEEHLYSLVDYPDAIPYVTSYYKERWGFCIAHNDRIKLKDIKYHVYIDSDLKSGSLTYADMLIPGDSKQEVLLSTYFCHPQMANNEISGPAVLTYLAHWIQSIPNRRYSYRIVFVPETIGSILYLSRNLQQLKDNVIAGFVLTCVGDNNGYSYLSSKNANTLADKVAKNILSSDEIIGGGGIKFYPFLERGSDERQYNAAGIDLPVCSIMRTKYAEYKEYHTSKDDLDFISPEGLNGSYELYQKIITALENNYKYQTATLCEPQLGKRGLYPSISYRGSATDVRDMMNFIAYADGTKDLIEISNIINSPIENLIQIATRLYDANVVIKC